MDWRDYLHSDNPVASALMAKMAIAPADRVRVKAECLRLLITLKLDSARSRFISGFIDTYLRLERDEAQRFERWFKTEISLNGQEKIMELTTSWKEEGLQLGLQQGLQQGIKQGESLVLKRLLTRRFKSIPPDVLLRIEQAVPEQLETWIENTLDATTLEEVFKDH